MSVAKMNKREDRVPIAVVMISLNEEHNIETVCRNLQGWAQEIFLVDSYSKDRTVSIALEHGVQVVQRPFRNFGDQWNFALSSLPITAPWTMKLDPDETITDELKKQIETTIKNGNCDGIEVCRRLFFMQSPLPVRQFLVRVWKTGKCKFTDVTVNEHPLVAGNITRLYGEINHYDSPDLDHWLEKQNRYTTAEALISYNGLNLAEAPKLFGNSLQRRMWLKKNFYRLPFRYMIFFLYNLLVIGAWRAGWVGWTWASLRCDVMRYCELKLREMKLTGRTPAKRTYGAGAPDPRVPQDD